MKAIAQVNEDCFSIANRGQVVFLKHQLDGIKRGTILSSEIRNLSWVIISRVLMEIITSEHHFFENESFDYILCNFKNDIEKKNAIKRLREQEDNNIYRYLVKGLNHDSAIGNNEVLTIEM
ncbi:MAG: hypothetical protein H6553_05085 [Chitinophagales bacterium]|nr:hypothetical protein [Chitinophagales bacterium]